MIKLFKVTSIGEVYPMQRKDAAGELVSVETLKNGEPAVRRWVVLAFYDRLKATDSGLQIKEQSLRVELIGAKAMDCQLEVGKWIVGEVSLYVTEGARGLFQNSVLVRYSPSPPAPEGGGEKPLPQPLP